MRDGVEALAAFDAAVGSYLDAATYAGIWGPTYFITFTSPSEEDLERNRQWIVDHYVSNPTAPVILSGHVHIERTARDQLVWSEEDGVWRVT